MSSDAVSEQFRAAAKQERVLTERARGLRRQLTALLFNTGVALRQPSISARALLQTVRPVGESAPMRRTIWVLSKEGLVEDSLAALRSESWASLYDFSRMCLKLLTERMLPHQLDDNIYASTDVAVEDAKRELRDCWLEILRALPRSARPEAIITSNFGYLFEREFAGACEEEGIPFVAVHKECFKAPGRLRFFSSTYPRRGRFTGRRVLVYNEHERNLLLNTGVAPASAITVTGMPRLDRIHSWRRNGGLGPKPQHPLTILAFGFTPAAGLPRIPRKERTGVIGGLDQLAPEFSGLSWRELFAQYHEALIRIARDNPDIRVVLKTKSRERDGRQALEFVKSLRPPANFEIVVGGDPLALIVASDAVIGFNTTGLCEAIASGLPVVVPNFAEAASGATVEYVADLGEAVFNAHSPNELASLAVGLARNPAARWPALNHEREKALHYWVANADGEAGLRVAEAIRAECETRS